MSSTRPLKSVPDRKLPLVDVLAWLEADGMLTAERVALLRGLAERGSYDDQHPLSVIGKRGWQDARPPHAPLTVEGLTVWLAQKVKLP